MGFKSKPKVTEAKKGGVQMLLDMFPEGKIGG